MMHHILVKCDNCCRAMLCISMAYAVVQCPSVCLSVTFVYCVKTRNHILKLFSPTGLLTVIVFYIKRYGNILMGTL